MAMAKGSRKASTVKNTMEQKSMGALNPSFHDDGAQAQYELATFRAARKTRSPARNKGAGVKSGATRGQ